MLIANNFSTATVFDFVLQALFSCFSISKSGQQANPVGNRDRKSPNKLYAINVDISCNNILYLLDSSRNSSRL